jgi:outer membrane protein TolC
MKRNYSYIIFLLALLTAPSQTTAIETAIDLPPNLHCQKAALKTTAMNSLPSMTFCHGRDQASSEVTTISAQTFLDLSLQGSELMQSQQQLVESAEYSLKSAKGTWWPNASMSNSSLLFVKNSGNNNPNVTGCTNNPSTAGTAFNPFNGSSSSCSASSQYTQAYPVITITWNFINPSRYPQIAGASKGISLANSQQRQTSQQLQLGLLKSYGTYLLAGFQLGELTSLIETESMMLTSTAELVSNRALPRYVRNQQSRNLLAYQARIETALALQNQAESEIKSALSQSSLGEKSVLPDLNSLVVKSWDYDEDQTIAMALSNSEQLKQLSLQSGIATDSANQLRGSILPTIGFLGYITYQGTDSAGSVSNLVSSYAGLSLTWNLFDGYSTKNQAIAADRQASSYLKQKADSERQLRLLVQNKLISLNSLKNQINIYLKDISHSQSILADLKSRMKFGFSSSSEVLEAQQDSHESRLNLINSITSYVMIYTELCYLCGISALT